MRIALPDGQKGLNDDGNKNADMKTIKEEVTKFRNSKKIKELASTDTAYKKMIKQIDKYWEKLFADPITVRTPTGMVKIWPQRTNNVLERFFRHLKRGYRKKGGNKSLSKTLKAMLVGTPLVKNLENPQYMEIILNGKKDLAERFAEIDIKLVHQELKEQQKLQQLLPGKMKKACKIANLPSKLARFANMRNAAW